MTTKVRINPGACQKKALIEAKKTGSKVAINIESDCSSVMKLSKKIKEMDKLDVIRRMSNNIVYKAASEANLHSACPVPCAILKAVEAELDLALKKDVKILFVKEQEKS
ncbi:MAG: hypothetical protein H3Z51_11160 [archaeon]|nr:hypothetical protein [archaeon]